MSTKNEGYIFLLTLCIILLISLLGVTMMQHILIYHKAVNIREKQHHDFYQLERLALDLARSPLDDLNRECVVSSDQGTRIVSELMKNKECSLRIDNQQFSYLIEELGDFSCLVVTQDEKQFSTHHRRVSLMFIAQEVPNSLLQIRYLAPIQLQDCLKTVHHVSLGVNSWRYIAAV